MDVLPILNNKIAPGVAHSNLKINFLTTADRDTWGWLSFIVVRQNKGSYCSNCAAHISWAWTFFFYVTFTGIDSPLIAERGSWIKYLLSQACATEFLSFRLSCNWFGCMFALVPSVTTQRGWVLSSRHTGLRVISQISENNALSCLV